MWKSGEETILKAYSLSPFTKTLSSSGIALLLFTFALKSLYPASVLGPLTNIPQYATPLNRWCPSEMSSF